MKLILYADGITPGSVLAPDNRRKSIVWYCSFLEFGNKLSYEEVWLPIALARTSLHDVGLQLRGNNRKQSPLSSFLLRQRGSDRTSNTHPMTRTLALRTKWAKKVKGGVSRLTRDILRGMFLGGGGVATDGVGLHLGGDVATVVRIEFQSLLGDEEALNSMLDIKGASGICPCGVLCSVTNKQRPQDRELCISRLGDIDASIKDISCAELNLCGARSDEDVWRLCSDLEACSADDLPELEHATGLKLNLNAILFDKELRCFFKPSSSTTYDPMHVLFSNGLMNAEIMLFMSEMKQSVGAYFADVRKFHQDSKWKPKTELFSEAREKSCTEFLKAGATETMSGYTLPRRYILECYGNNASEPHVVSFLLLCEVCDEIRMHFKKMSEVDIKRSCSRLRDLTRKSLQTFVHAYGEHRVRFKHHQVLHLPDHIEKHMRMLNCWVLERKHIGSKEAIQHNRKVANLEGSGLSRMLNRQVRMLESPGWGSALLEPTRPFPEVTAALSATRADISSAMRWTGITLRISDVVFLDVSKSCLVVVVACVATDTAFAILVRVCLRLGGTDTASTWKVDPKLVLHELTSEGVCGVSFYRYLSADQLEVLH